MPGHTIHIEVEGSTYSGTYKVDRQVLTVTTNYGKTATVRPKMAHAALADQLLHEMVREEKGPADLSRERRTQRRLQRHSHNAARRAHDIGGEDGGGAVLRAAPHSSRRKPPARLPVAP
jgi:hypothetical protein